MYAATIHTDHKLRPREFINFMFLWNLYLQTRTDLFENMRKKLNDDFCEELAIASVGAVLQNGVNQV